MQTFELEDGLISKKATGYLFDPNDLALIAKIKNADKL
jgi:hypothetical protein